MKDLTKIPTSHSDLDSSNYQNAFEFGNAIKNFRNHTLTKNVGQPTINKGKIEINAIIKDGLEDYPSLAVKIVGAANKRIDIKYNEGKGQYELLYDDCIETYSNGNQNEFFNQLISEISYLVYFTDRNSKVVENLVNNFIEFAKGNQTQQDIVGIFATEKK